MEPEQAPENQIQRQGLLLDTSILLPLTDREWRRRIFRHLTTLADKYDFAISEISIFEIFRRANIGEPERTFYRDLLNPRAITVVEISSLIVQNAWILCRCAHPTKIDGEAKKNVTADMIIGGSVSSNSNGLLLTTDRSDFAMPFWKLLDKHLIVIDDADGYRTKTVYLLKFDYCALDREFLTEEMVRICDGGQTPLLLPPGTP